MSRNDFSKAEPGTPLAGGTRMAAAGRYLLFEIGADRYGLPVQRVREIIRSLDELTRIPQMPEYVSGCLNLRGTVIPVVNLQRKFDIAPAASPAIRCIVIAEVRLAGDSLLMGLVVDAVEEVVHLKAPQLAPAPEFGGELDTRFICGMGKVKNRLVLLLDVDRVIAAKTLIAMKDRVAEVEPSDAVNYQ